ncbi:hypothetical protein GJR96_04340 [Haloferax sp. MBLA0076]|uniref:Cox cluster protein n=1 Tax=Haloferax litoreum TaxID=2666140 RepID=A0A6A8GG90_9EURY|nr:MULTISPECIES: hypothetical protein [Haloferax]KAB1192710.1 hypothetical protein Hfx1148_04330 [Haloferax sp. CBA1148]MRX21187.1 hypothetical protein [Haloferax litoreum]
MPSDSLSPEERRQYDVVYHATKNAIWDVLGTAVYLLFLVFALGITLLGLVFPALGELASGGTNPFVLGVGGVGFLVALIAAHQIYSLSR